MSTFLPFIIVGLVTGSLYGLSGVGLVLTYKTTGVFNFAHGGVAAIAAYVFYDVHQTIGVPWPLALVGSVVVVATVLGLAFERLGRILARSRPVLSVVATVGALLISQGVLAAIYGAQTLPYPAFLPTSRVQIGGVAVSYEQILVAVIGLAAAIALLVYFRRSRTGVAMRAVVDDPSLLSLAAIPPVRIRRAAWIVGCGFAALSGALLASFLGRDPLLLTLLIVQAFGAAAIGRFTSLPMTYVGGVAVGIATSLVTYVIAQVPALQGLDTSLPFLVLLVALLVIPRRRLFTPAQGISRPTRTPRAWTVQQRAAGLVVLLLVAVVLPEVVGAQLPIFINAVALMPLFLSLALLVWVSGQISLGHAAFVALGASTFGHLAGSAGLPWFLALLLAGLAVVPLGAMVAIPAIRVSGVYLALATFGFGLLVERMLYGTSVMFGSVGFLNAPRPSFPFFDGTSDRGYFLVVIAVVAVCFGVTALLQRGRLGTLLRALGDNPTALTSLGTDTNVVRVLVFCIAGFLAGISGALSIGLTSQVSVDTFGLEESLVWLTVIGICGGRLMVSPVIAALLVAVLPSYLPEALATFQAQAMLFGVAAVVASVLADRDPGGGGRGGGVSPRLAARQVSADEAPNAATKVGI